MSGKGFRLLFVSICMVCLLLCGSIVVLAQGQPWHLPAPGQMPMMPTFPVGMEPRGPLPYSWEVGKHRHQSFGDLDTGKRSKEVKKLLKMKMKEQKAQKNKS